MALEDPRPGRQAGRPARARGGSGQIASARHGSLQGARMSRLWRYVARYRLRLLAGIVCLIGATSLAMTVPWLVKTVVDRMAAGEGVRAISPTIGAIVCIA